MGNKKTPDLRGWANPELARAMHGLRSSSAAQPHTPDPRKGTRAERRRRAVHDQDEKSTTRD